MKKLIKNTHKPVDNDKNVVGASDTKTVRDYGPDENGLYGPFKTAEERRIVENEVTRICSVILNKRTDKILSLFLSKKSNNNFKFSFVRFKSSIRISENECLILLVLNICIFNLTSFFFIYSITAYYSKNFNKILFYLQKLIYFYRMKSG